MNTGIERLDNGRPRYTVRMNAPRSPRHGRSQGCPTFEVFDHARQVIVHGPTTFSQEAAEMCGRFSLGADLALMPLPVNDARQMRMEV